jgi:hypothetical protein
MGPASPLPGAEALQPEKKTLLLSSVTAPVCARALPLMLAPVVTVMLASARMFPMNDVLVPSVAELPTCQKTLQGWAPLISRTLALLAVMSVLSIWKMNTALALPWALSVRLPVIPAAGCPEPNL